MRSPQQSGIMSASTLVLLVVAPINAALHLLFVHHMSFGLIGASIALSLTYWIMFALICLYAVFSPTRKRNESWAGLDLPAILDPGSSWRFLKLAVPGILMVGTECSSSPFVPPTSADKTNRGRIPDRRPCCRHSRTCGFGCPVCYHDQRRKCVEVVHVYRSSTDIIPSPQHDPVWYRSRRVNSRR
jgi:hypothetical protein